METILGSVEQDTTLMQHSTVIHNAGVPLWINLCRSIMFKSWPFDAVWALIKILHQNNRDTDPWVVWHPDAETIAQSNINALMTHVGITNFRDLHRWSVEHNTEYWAYIISKLNIIFQTKPISIAVPTTNYNVKNVCWLPGSSYNIVESIFQNNETHTAIVFGDEISNLPQRCSFLQLRTLANKVSNALVFMGYSVGDAIGIDMPMTMESVAIYLGIIQAGMIVVSIADSFSAPEIRKRLEISNAKGIFTVSGYCRGGKRIDMLTKVCDAVQHVTTHHVRIIVVDDRTEETRNIQVCLSLCARTMLSARRKSTTMCDYNDTGVHEPMRQLHVCWSEIIADQPDSFVPVRGCPDQYTNILFSSGTTGDPKAIPWTQTTPIKAAADGLMHHDIHAGDVVCWPTNLGWMMGPWLIYQLLNSATIALFNGSPGLACFGEFVQNARVTILGTIPTIVRSWKTTRCMEQFNWSTVRVFTSTGECSHPEEVAYLQYLNNFRAPMIEYCGGTEIGGGYITGSVVQDSCLCSFSTPALGVDFSVLTDSDSLFTCTEVGQVGEAFIHPPSIGLSSTLLNRNHDAEYYESCPLNPSKPEQPLRRHGDVIKILHNGYFQVMGRIDDTMNLGGIKVSSAELERCMSFHPDVFEVAAFGIPGRNEPTRLVAVVVPRTITLANASTITCQTMRAELQKIICMQINPLFKLHAVILVEQLAKTSSNKIMRRELRQRYTNYFDSPECGSPKLLE